MNSFENSFASRPDEEASSLETEQPTAVASETPFSEHQQDELQRLKQESVDRLSFHLDKAPQPEGALSQMLRQLSAINPYADRLLSTLGYDAHTLSPRETLTNQDQQLEQNITRMLRQVGEHVVDDVLTTHDSHNQEYLTKRLEDLTARMQRGAASLVEGRFNPLSGYFQKVVVSEDGTVQQFEQQDRERWAKAVLWQAPGVGELPEVRVSEEEQEELLEGYLAATLAIAPQRSVPMEDVPRLLTLLAGPQDRSSAHLKQHFGDSLAFLRSQVVEEIQRDGLDRSLLEVGMLWDEESKQYEAAF